MSARRILFVDDEPELRGAIAECLALEGHTVVEASNITEAEQSFFEQRFDVVITDLRLPDGCGLDLLSRLRAIDTQFNAVVTTGFGTYEQALQAIRLRVSAFLSKPFLPDELLKIVAEEQPGAPGPCESRDKSSAPATPRGMEQLTQWAERALAEMHVEPWVAARALSLLCEALQNAVQHAFPERPGTMEIGTLRDGASLVIQVSDQGCGFDVSKAIAAGLRRDGTDGPSILPGMIRFHMEADEVRIASDPGRGTTIILRFRNAFAPALEPATEMSDDDLAVACLWS